MDFRKDAENADSEIEKALKLKMNIMQANPKIGSMDAVLDKLVR